MAMVKRMACLANLRKLNGRCVAGKELVGDTPVGWLRPVSNREHEEVSEYERQYENGSDPRVLDIIDVPLLAAKPKGYQQENWLLDADEYWRKVGTWNDLNRLVDPVAPLWINGHNTYNGRNDKIPLLLAQSLDSSLRFVRVDRLRLSVFKPGEAFGNPKRRVQARFHHCGDEYALWVTDPSYEHAYLAQPDGYYEIGECFLAISLGEPYNDCCYKLVAAIIPRAAGGSA